MSKPRKNDGPLGFSFGSVLYATKSLLYPFSNRVWLGGEHIPQTGGCVVSANHLTYLDPFVFGLYVYESGRQIRYLAKQEIFETPILKHLAKNAGQIKVPRLTTAAADSFNAAVAAVQQGNCVGIYPEGTLTRDPDLWPMRGKTGAARVALATGCPLIPVGHWGAQEMLPRYSKKFDLLPRKTLVVKAGPAVDLSDLAGAEITALVLSEATDRLMAAITGLVAEIRDEVPPIRRFDPKDHDISQIGNPNQPKGKDE